MVKSTVYHSGASQQRAFISYPYSYALRWLFDISSATLKCPAGTETEINQKTLKSQFIRYA